MDNNQNKKNNKNNPNNNRQGLGIVLITTLLVAFVLIGFFSAMGNTSQREISYDKFLKLVKMCIRDRLGGDVLKKGRKQSKKELAAWFLRTLIVLYAAAVVFGLSLIHILTYIRQVCLWEIQGLWLLEDLWQARLI